LTQSVSIQSKEVSKIENISRNITNHQSWNRVHIFFTAIFLHKLSDVKQEMIANATKDAKERAEKIAENAEAVSEI
jgi:hypothetical protein